MDSAVTWFKSAAGTVLHAVVNTALVSEARVDISDPSEFLQVSVIGLAQTAETKPHIHRLRGTKTLSSFVTQETWIVIRGQIKARLFDEERVSLGEVLLSAGQLLVTFRGGHSLKAVVAGSLIIECKNGPYEGRDYDVIEAVTGV